MFKKILFLILLVPVAHSEILELTCEVPMPIHIVYDFEKKEGYVNVPDDDGVWLTESGKQKIKKLDKIGDYYRIQTRGVMTNSYYVNRITLRAVMTYATNYAISGQCEKGLKTYDKYQI